MNTTEPTKAWRILNDGLNPAAPLRLGFETNGGLVTLRDLTEADLSSLVEILSTRLSAPPDDREALIAASRVATSAYLTEKGLHVSGSFERGFEDGWLAARRSPVSPPEDVTARMSAVYAEGADPDDPRARREFISRG